MAKYISLVKYTEKGIENIKEIQIGLMRSSSFVNPWGRPWKGFI
jgi:uncharacterized protein with GYD domain